MYIKNLQINLDWSLTMKTKEHTCQVYDFVSIREAIMEKKEEEAKQLEQDNITLDLFTIRDMILNGFDPSSTEDLIKYGEKIGYEIDFESETWNPLND